MKETRRRKEMDGSTAKLYLDQLKEVFEHEDMFVEILKRLLDVKHIHRCKCVSKRWYKTISSTGFARCYTIHKSLTACKRPPFNLFYHHVHGFHSAFKPRRLFKSPGFSLDFLPPPPQPEFPQGGPYLSIWTALSIAANSRVVSASNGLLLRCDTSLSYESQSCRLDYYVCNPLTKQWVAIASPPTANPSKPVRVGFLCRGDASFRIVRVPSFKDEMPPVMSVEIYASETGKWSESAIENYMKATSLFREVLYCPERSSAIACNGLLHWSSSKYVFVYDPYNNNNKHIPNILKLPREGSDMAKECGLGECNRRLRCIVPGYMDSLVVWELKDYHKEGEWNLVKRICLNEMTIQDPVRMPVDMSYKCLCFHPFDENVVFLWQFFRVVSCNMQAKTVTHLRDLVGNSSKSPLHPVGLPIVLPWWPMSPTRTVEEH